MAGVLDYESRGCRTMTRGERMKASHWGRRHLRLALCLECPGRERFYKAGRCPYLLQTFQTLHPIPSQSINLHSAHSSHTLLPPVSRGKIHPAKHMLTNICRKTSILYHHEGQHYLFYYIYHQAEAYQTSMWRVMRLLRL